MGMAAKVTAANTSKGNQVARCSLRTRCASSRVLDSSRRGSSSEYAEPIVMDNRLVSQTNPRKKLVSLGRTRRVIPAMLDHRSSIPTCGATAKPQPLPGSAPTCRAEGPRLWRGPSAAGYPGWRHADPVRRLLGIPGELVGEQGEAVTNSPGMDEAHGFLFADSGEEALASPERDGVDHQP